MGTQTLETPVNEALTPVLTVPLLDEDGAAIPKASLTTLTLTLYYEASGTIINSRDGQDILDANNGAVSSTGVVTLTLQPADLAAESTARYEWIVALLEWTYNAGALSGSEEIRFPLRNLAKVE